ncbi:MAG: malonyl-ACP O-methyltransferase BioC [Halioglobus sp.]
MRAVSTEPVVEFLPATQRAMQEIVFLHGWGCNRDVWRPLLVHLRQWLNITLVEVPGCSTALSDFGLSQAAHSNLGGTLESIVERCPARAVYLGWSLGGQLAIEIARLMPDRVSGVVTVCSNPRFVALDDWPGMSTDLFSQFCDSARSDISATFRRFYALQCAGSTEPQKLLRQLRSLGCEHASMDLLAGLQWLGDLDVRESLSALPVPQLHLLADSDSLVPHSVADTLAALCSSSAALSKIEILADTTHVAPLDSPEEIAASLQLFFQEASLLYATSFVPDDFEKKDVAESFSKAAVSYDAAAALQRDVGSALLSRLGAISIPVKTVLDLGCGTGHFGPALRERFPYAHHLGMDIAPGMVAYARSKHSSEHHWAVADAESLPLASNSVDVIFSSLALQWCSRLDLLFAELGRVLRPGGRCVFATLGPDTLKELRASWASVDERQHVNRFFHVQELAEVADSRDDIELALETQPFVMEYDCVNELLRELKAIGAHNVNRNRASGLTGRASLRGMQQSYEEWRSHGKLPATYEVVFGILEAA